MSDFNVLDQLGEVEELNIAQRLTKEFLDHEKISEEELSKVRKEKKIPEDIEYFGVDISTLRQFARMLAKVYKNYDFPRFFKLIEILWVPEASLDEHYLALLLLQTRKKDLAEVDVCLDLWNFIWSDFKENVHDWSLTEMIAITIGYQIIETWQSIEDDEETSQMIWDSLKEKAADERNGPFGKIFAIMCPIRRIRKLGQDAVLPSLEVVLSAIAKFEAEEREIGKAMERAIILTLRECAKTDSVILLKFIEKFYKIFPLKVIKDMRRYYREEHNTEYQKIFKSAKEYQKEQEEEDDEDDEDDEDED